MNSSFVKILRRFLFTSKYLPLNVGQLFLIILANFFLKGRIRLWTWNCTIYFSRQKGRKFDYIVSGSSILFIYKNDCLEFAAERAVA